MIPIIFDADLPTVFSDVFNGPGLGHLAECTRCVVTEELNGIFECEFDYPINGRHYSRLIPSHTIIYVLHDDSGHPEPFDIYDMTEDISGITTFYARHYSYRLSGYIMKPVEFSSAADAFSKLGYSNSYYNRITLRWLEFYTDVTTTGTVKTTIPTSTRTILCGNQNSVLSVYGGELKYEWPYVKLLQNRGQETGKTLRYGMNITDFRRSSSANERYNAIVPYWYNAEWGYLQTLTEGYLPLYNDIPQNLLIAKPYDMTSWFETMPSESELRNAAQTAIQYDISLLEAVGLRETIDISFTQLWQTPEYKDYSFLQHLTLGDKVNVQYSPLGLNLENMPISKVVYNVLEERYDSMVLGTLEDSFFSAFEKDLNYKEMEIIEEDDAPTQTNLFDPNNVVEDTNTFQLYIATSGTHKLTGTSDYRLICVPVQAGHTYTVSSGISSTKRWGYTTATPAAGVAVSAYGTTTGTLTDQTIEVGTGGQYIVLQIFANGDSDMTPSDYYSSIYIYDVTSSGDEEILPIEQT